MLDRVIDYYNSMASSNQRVRERYGDAVLDIPGHETVLRPRETLQKHLINILANLNMPAAGS